MSSNQDAAEPDRLYGITQARLFPEPLRPLTRETTYGYDVADFARKLGRPLLPWQEWAVTHCMEIDPDTGQYRFRTVLIMVSRQQGKSHLTRVITLWRMLYDEDCEFILGTAQDLAQASNQWKLTLNLVKDSPFLRKRLAYDRHVNGQEAFGLKNGAEYLVRSATPDAARGFSVDGLVIDELRTQKDRRAWAALNYTTMARPNPLTLLLSNAGSDESIVLNQVRDSALSGREPSIGLFEWSAWYDEDKDEYCDLHDWDQIRQANPALGYTISESAIRSALSDDPAVVRTEVFCQRVHHMDGAVDMSAWAACADPSVTMDGLRDRLAVCFDVAPDDGHATLAVAAKTPEGKVRGELAAVWPSASAARTALPELLARIRPMAIAWYPSGPAGSIASVFRPADGKPVKLDRAAPGRPAYVDLSSSTACEACMGLASLVKGHQVLHSDDPLLNSHIGAASRLKSGDGWRFARKQVPANGPKSSSEGKEGDHPVPKGHVDAAYAFAGAVHLALMLPPPRRARIRVIAG